MIELTDRLHPHFQMILPAMMELIEYAKGVSDDPEHLQNYLKKSVRMSSAWKITKQMLNPIHLCGGPVYVLPFLSPEYCYELVEEARRLGRTYGWRPNPDEQAAYQIPEIVLAHADPSLAGEVQRLLPFLNVWIALAYQTEASRIASIQFAKYTPDDTPNGNWHHDRDSQFSAVVSLAPELHQGGGTELRESVTKGLSVGPLQSGYMMLFNGKLIQHRGMAVERGVRHLLVFWLN